MAKFFRVLLFLAFLAVFVFSGQKLFSSLTGYKAARNRYAEAADRFVTRTSPAAAPNPAPQAAEFTPEPTEAPPTPVPEPTPAATDGTASESGIAIDFGRLTALSPDAVGWIYCPDTQINYPVVQAQDNTFYLTQTFDGWENKSGAIFMDANSDPYLLDDNTIIYGHNMKDTSMFYTVTLYQDQSFYDQHPVLYYLTPEGNYRIELFAGMIVESESIAFVPRYPNQAEKQNYIDVLYRKSSFKSNVKADWQDHLVTLSTCNYTRENSRYIVCGVLREEQQPDQQHDGEESA